MPAVADQMVFPDLQATKGKHYVGQVLEGTSWVQMWLCTANATNCGKFSSCGCAMIGQVTMTGGHSHERQEEQSDMLMRRRSAVDRPTM